MKRQLGLSLVVLAVLWVPPAWSQTGDDQSQNDAASPSQSGSANQSENGSTDESQQSSTGPQVAYTHPEKLPSLALLNEVTANTGIKLYLATGLLTTYSLYRGSYWQTLGTITAGGDITQIRPTMMWNLRYNGGVSLDALSSRGRSNNYTTMTQNAAAKVIWQLSPRWQLSLQDNYLSTIDPFESYFTIDHVPTFNNPNPIIYIPRAVTETNVGSIELIYRMSAHDSFNFTGGESFQRFFNTALTAQDSYTYSGGSYYQHQLSERLSAGGGYSFTALDFGHGLSRSGIQAIVGFASYQVTPNIYVTGWVGPENTSNKNIVPTFCYPGFGCFDYHAVYESQWTVAEGGTFGWSRARDAVQVGFRHQVSNGGGLLGTVRYYQLTAAYRRALTRKWSLVAGFSYNDSLSLVSAGSSDRFLKSLHGSVSFGRNISQAWNASVYYSVINQHQNYYLGQPTSLGTNGVGFLLRYSWGHSLGR